MNIIDYCNERINARGFNYYKSKLVKNLKKIDDSYFTATVLGNEEYEVKLHLDNIHKCYCSCPHSKKICKHLVATYYEVNREEALLYEQIIKSLIETKKAYDKRKQEEYELLYNEAKAYVESLTIDEMKQEIIYNRVNQIISSCYDKYDERYEEEFAILDDINWDLLE